MKTLLILLALSLTASPSFAGVNMKPGLWDVKTNMKTAPGEVDPMEKMKESMAKLSPERRQQIEAMMAKQGMSTAGGGMSMKVCYTAEMIKNPESIAKGHQKSSHCTTKLTDQSSSKMNVDLQCENGSKGTGTWNFSSDQYTGSMSFTDKNGKNSQMVQNAKFISSDCGTVKPFTTESK